MTQLSAKSQLEIGRVNRSLLRYAQRGANGAIPQKSKAMLISLKKVKGIFLKKLEKHSNKIISTFSHGLKQIITLQQSQILKIPKIVYPRWDSNPQSSAQEADALSIGPRGLPVNLQVYQTTCTLFLAILHRACLRATVF